MKNIYTLLLICAVSTGYSQQGFGTSNPAPSSVIDMVASNKGALLPRVALTSTTVAAPVPSPANALTVFNTATAGDVTPGYYYWSTAGTKWIKLIATNDLQEPWKIQATTSNATLNTDNIYQQGKVAIGTTSTAAASTYQLDVTGDFKTSYANGGIYNDINTNYPGVGTLMYVGNNADPEAATERTTFALSSDFAFIESLNGSALGGYNGSTTATGGTARIVAVNAANNVTSTVDVNSFDGGASNVQLSHGKVAKETTTVTLEKTAGVKFDFMNPAGAVEGNYTFPRVNGSANQILTTDGATGAQLSWKDASTLVPYVEPFQVQGTTTKATANTNNIYQQGNVSIGSTSATAASTTKLEVVGDLKASYANGTNYNGINTNYGGGSVMYVANDIDPGAANNSSLVYLNPDFATIQSHKGVPGADIGTYSYTMGGIARLSATNGTLSSEITADANMLNNIQLKHGKGGAESAIITIEKLSGVNFNFQTTANAFEGSYTFPRNNGTANQVLTTDGTSGSTAQLSWKNVSTLIPATTNTLTATSGNLVSTVNGVASTPAVPVLISANNGLTATSGNVKLGGALTAATTITTTTTNTLALTGLQAGSTIDNVMVSDAVTGVLKTVTTASVASLLEPWQIQGGTTKATANTDNIYQQGTVSIGVSTATPSGDKLYVSGGNIETTGSLITGSSVYADYVFDRYFDGSSKIDNDYRFKSLAEVNEFIKKNKHLPGVTSIKDINKTATGYSVDMTKLSIQSLEKIEELYLHTIEQQTLIEKQQTEIQDMKTRLERLEKLLTDKK